MIPFQAPERQNRGLAPGLAARANEWLGSPESTSRTERELLEKALTVQSGFAHAVAVSSGFEAVQLALVGLRLPAGSEIVVGSALAQEAVTNLGLRAVTVDFAAPEPLQRVTTGTRAVIAAAPFGRQGDMEVLRKLCTGRGLHLLEESAPGLPNRRPTAAVYAFSSRSVLTVPGALGALLTDDPILATRLREARQSRQCSADFWGAALLRAKLPKLSSFLSLRRSIAQWYLAAFETEFARGAITLPAWPKDPATHVWEQFAIGVPDPARMKESLLKAGVETQVPMAGKPLLSLPLYPELSGKEVQLIAERVRALIPSLARRPGPRVEFPEKSM